MSFHFPENLIVVKSFCRKLFSLSSLRAAIPGRERERGRDPFRLLRFAICPDSELLKESSTNGALELEHDRRCRALPGPRQPDFGSPEFKENNKIILSIFF